VRHQTLLVARAGAMATITLNRPEARNAIDMVMRQELVAALDEVEGDEAARVPDPHRGRRPLLRRGT
jgi:enoyl-CoA hydratase/carnithine racemase